MKQAGLAVARRTSLFAILRLLAFQKGDVFHLPTDLSASLSDISAGGFAAHLNRVGQSGGNRGAI